MTLTACGSGDGSGDGGGGGGSDAATATSAEDFGGMDALVEAAQEEGTLNVIALPPDWANYGEMLDAFSEKYDIEINSASPDGSSQDELNAVTSQRGQDRAPDVLDLGTAFARQAAGAEPARALPGRRPGTRSPRARRTPTATGTTTTAATSPSAATPRSSPSARPPSRTCSTRSTPGQVALNGNPTQAAAAFGGVWAASLANGGGLDDIGPGIDFFAQVKDVGNFNPVEITPGHHPER